MSRLYIARITLEAASPLSVGSGEAGVSDVSLVRDANGLPMIAGASIQGLMKALAKRDGLPAMGLLGDNDYPGKIQFSDARIHGSDDVAVSGVILEGVADDLLQRYLDDEPLKRDHVKLDNRGTSDDHHKFDRAALPRGTRMSFELSMWGDADDQDKFTSLLSLLYHPLFRLGGATRRGYGRVKVRAGRWRFWADPLEQSGPISKLREAAYSVISDDWTEIASDEPSFDTKYKLSLNSDSWWRAGGDGVRVRTGKYRNPSADNRKDDTDAAFTREPSISWDTTSNQKGWIDPGDVIAEDYVLAGSSIRGALWHRTLYHWNLHNRNFVDLDAKDDADVKRKSKAPPAMLALFGEAKQGDDGQRSALIIDDIVFTPAHVTVADHVSIDRFTGGARNGALFSEELVQIDDAGIEVHIIIDEQLLAQRAQTCLFDEKVILDAFKAAVEDLCNNRLALGAKSSGYFTGTCTPPIMTEAAQ